MFQNTNLISLPLSLPTPVRLHMVHTAFTTGHPLSPVMPPRSSRFLMPPPQTYFWAITNYVCFLNPTTILQACMISLDCLSSMLISTPISHPSSVKFTSLGKPAPNKSNTPLMCFLCSLGNFYFCSYIRHGYYWLICLWFSIGSLCLKGGCCSLFILVLSKPGNLVRFELRNFMKTGGKLVLDLDLSKDKLGIKRKENV